MNCPKCGNPVQADANFCRSCGARQERAPVIEPAPAPRQEIPGTYSPPAASPPPATSLPPAAAFITNSGKAIASLILGIGGLICCGGIIPSVLAIVFGVLGKREIDESNGKKGGRGMAQAGLILGIVGIALGVIVGIVYIVLMIKGKGRIRF